MFHVGEMGKQRTGLGVFFQRYRL